MPRGKTTERRNLPVFGATGTTAEHSWTFDELTDPPHATVVADP